MKQLEITFETNADKMGMMRFTQVKRNDKVALYRRDKLDGTFFSYEVFLVKTVKAGTALPGGVFVEEDYESYPRGNSFGKTAWEHRTLIMAERKYEELLHRDDIVEDDETEVEGVKTVKHRVTRPVVVYPTTDTFTMKELLAVNPEYNQPLMYQYIQQEITGSKVQEAGTVAGGRGRAQVKYELVK